MRQGGAMDDLGLILCLFRFTQKFPEYQLAVDTLWHCIGVKPESMLPETILDILKQMKKKTDKEACILHIHWHSRIL